jgi:type IV secretory pathway TraG/TraD family ATPase VirD4
MSYNFRYLKYDIGLSTVLTVFGYLLLNRYFELPLSSFYVRLLILVLYSGSFTFVALARTRIQEYNERPIAKKGTRILQPKLFNKTLHGEGLGIPCLNKKGDTELLRIKLEDEATHIQVVGDTGTGKSALFHYFLKQIAEREDEQVIIYDPSGEYWKYHSSAERGDIWLCPFSENCPNWDLAAELTDNLKAPRLLAKSFLPSKDGEASFWEDGARSVMEFLLKEVRSKNASVSELVKWMSDSSKVLDILKGSYAYQRIDPDSPDVKVGMLATLMASAESLALLPVKSFRRNDFAFSQWVQERKGWLFIGANGVADQEILQPLISIWFDIAVRQLTTSSINKPKPTWIFIDELSSLKHLPSLPKALDQARKYNIRLVLGFQGRNQLYQYYDQLAEAMLSACSTKIFLRNSNYDSAKWVAENIGLPEIVRRSYSHSWQLTGERDSVSARNERREEYMILPNEIQNLENRHGYLRYGNWVTPIHFSYPQLESETASTLERVLLLPSAPTARP